MPAGACNNCGKDVTKKGMLRGFFSVKFFFGTTASCVTRSIGGFSHSTYSPSINVNDHSRQKNLGQSQPMACLG